MSRVPRRGAVEYRVRWQRRGWLGPKQRIMSDRQAVDRLLRKLTGPDRSDLAPFVVLRVDERPTGRWRSSARVTIPSRRKSA